MKKVQSRVALALTVTAFGVTPSVEAADTIRVSRASTCDPNTTTCGEAWGNFAYPKLLDALANASSNSKILVAEGTYLTNESDLGLAIGDRTDTFDLVTGGIDLIGGYTHTGGGPDPVANETILSGDIDSTGNADSYHVITVTATGSDVLLKGFTIEGGKASSAFGVNRQGAGIYIGDSDPVIEDCVIKDNEANGRGAGAYITSDSTASFARCTFHNNAIVSSLPSATGGGAVYAEGDPTFTHCVFTENSQLRLGSGGGAVLLETSNAAPTFTNCTFYGNTAVGTGGGIKHNVGATSTVTNSIFWGNTGSGSTESDQIDGGSPTVTYSCIEGCSTSTGGLCETSSDENIGDDPEFVNTSDLDGPDNIFGTKDDGLALTLFSAGATDSPCIGTGDNGADTDANTAGTQAIPATDITRCDSITDGACDGTATIDRGAYETGTDGVASSTRLYVDAGVSGGCWDGSSWDDAIANLDIALCVTERMSTVTEIWVAEGTYKPANTRAGNSARMATFKLFDDVSLYGGFADCQASSTNCDELTDVGLFCNGGDNDGRPCESTSDCPGTGSPTCDANATILSGDIDSNDGDCCKQDSDCADGYCVGGPWVCAGSPTSEACDDFDINDSLGVCVDGDNAYHVVTYDVDDYTAAPVLDGFVIKYGMADGNGPNDSPSGVENQGGAVQIRSRTQPCIDGQLQLRDSIFKHNFALNHGAVNDHSSNTVVNNCVFSGNRTTDNSAAGAGINIHSGSTEISNSLFIRNQSSGGVGEGEPEGGALWSGTDAHTSCTTSGEGNAASAPEITNCVFRENGAFMRGGAILARGSTPNVTGCTFDSNLTGNGGGQGGAGVWLEETPTGETSLFEDCVFSENFAGALHGTQVNIHFGGALYTQCADVEVRRCRFENNKSGGVGGAVTNLQGVGKYINCTFVGNQVNDGAIVNMQGGALAAYASTVISCSDSNDDTTDVLVLNSTIVENNAGTDLGGLVAVALGAGTLAISNSIVWNNSTNSTDPTECGVISPTNQIDPAIVQTNCLVYDSDPETEDPDFVTEPDCTWDASTCTLTCEDFGDLHLGSASDAIDAGDNDELDLDGDSGTTDVPYDFSGITDRIINSIVDIGAFEYNPN